MSLIAELKRRNVFRMFAAYVVLAWLVMQVGDVLSQTLDLPTAWNKGLLALVLLGFIPMLIFSWVYELTPEGLKKESEIAAGKSITAHTAKKLDITVIVLLMLASGLFVYGRFLNPDDSSPGLSGAPQTQVSAQKPPQSEKSIAVLPLRNVGADPANETFTVGIHDDLLTRISRIGDLRTISRTSVMQYLDTTKTIPQIAEELGVAAVLEGGVQRSGDRVRINMQLIDAGTDAHLWAEVYDRNLTVANLFEVQSEIADAVATALEATLSPEVREAIARAPTQVMAAYDLYQMGRHHWNKRTGEDMELARDYFQQALDADPDFVLALSGLADSYTLLVDYGNMDSGEAYPLADAAIQRAMKLDDEVSEVWASLGLLRMNQGREKESQEALKLAIELDANNFQAWHWYQMTLGSLRRFEESLEAAKRAYALEPMHLASNWSLGGHYERRGDFDRARQHWARVDQVQNVNPTLHKESGARCLVNGGDLAMGVATLREILGQDPGNFSILRRLSRAYLLVGNVAEARRWSETDEAINPLASRAMYWIHEAETDYPTAVAYLEDKLTLLQQRRDMWTLYLLFRATYLGGEIDAAHRYLAEYLSHLDGRVEINRFATNHRLRLLIASFLIEHGGSGDHELPDGQAIVDEVLDSLSNLIDQGFHHPDAYVSLALAQALSGRSLEVLDSLGRAVDAGFRDGMLLAREPALQKFRESGLLDDVIDRVESLVSVESQRLEDTALVEYPGLPERPTVMVSSALLSNYLGHYTDDNVVFRFYLAEDGKLMVDAAFLDLSLRMQATSDNEFFTPLMAGSVFEFVTDDANRVTHMLLKDRGQEQRFKAIDPPRPEIELESEVVDRYLGRFGWDRHAGREDRTEADLLVLEVSLDEDGTLWFDFDNQPRLRGVAISETEFRLPGFYGYFHFEPDPSTGEFNRIIRVKGGSRQDFNRLNAGQG